MLKDFTREGAHQSPCVLILGGFDGLHVGHQTLVDAALRYGLPVGITSISGGKAGGDVFTFPEREYIYRKAGVSFVYEMTFSDELKNTPPERFARDLFAQFDARAIVCGDDFRFGKGAEGTPELLRSIAPCPVEVCDLKRVNGEKVATSMVKKLLSEGSMSEVNALLPFGYFVQGKVEHGRRVGHTLGFPTVNLTFPPEKFPVMDGVYGGRAETEKGEFPAIVNFGARPTFGVSERKVEAYLDGFDGDLYGTSVRVFPEKFYRPVTKFADAAALRDQLGADIERLRHD